MSLGDAVSNFLGRNPAPVAAAAVAPIAPATTDPMQDHAPMLTVPKQECPHCGSENVVVEAHPLAGMEDMPSRVRRCLNPFCKLWDAIA